jgi:phosphoserine phosphatase
MLNVSQWQLQLPINAVIFDCDGTLSAIEGIDELARLNGAGEAVSTLTAEAMDKFGINPDLYAKRLQLAMPREEQVLALGETYYAHRVPDAVEVIQTLQELNKKVYLVSAGLYQAVAIFGALLKIPASQIFAVDIQFDEQGHYLNFDSTSPLTQHEGKRQIASQLQAQHHSIAYIGDGMNDAIAKEVVTRFVGYGGIFYRDNIAAACEFYIKSKSIASLLPLLLTQQESLQLSATEKLLYQAGLAAIDGNAVDFHFG